MKCFKSERHTGRRAILCHTTTFSPLMGAALGLLMLLASQTASADPALARSRNCMACHAVETKLVGPSFKDIAKRYTGLPEAEANVARKIVEGSTGTWGPMPMPANSQVKPEEARKLARWILELG